VSRTIETWCYRFYSNNSNFIHGGIDGRPEEQQPVTGQAVSIHSVYQCLNVVSITQCVMSYELCQAVSISVCCPCVIALLCFVVFIADVCDSAELGTPYGFIGICIIII